MVAPITGPYQQEIGGTGPDNQTFYSFQKGYKQARPYTLPLPYNRHVGQVQSRVGSPPSGARRFGTQDTINYYDFVNLQNLSYDKLRENTYDSAQMLVNLLEGRQALSMIVNRAGQLVRFGNRLRKLDFVGATRELRLATVPKGVSTKKSFASNWLEYYFGWVPLIGDIHSAVDILQSPLKDQFVSAVKTAKSGTYYDLQQPYEMSRPTAFNDWSYIRFYERVSYPLALVRQGHQVAVSNPNLFLANQLGLVNPATVIWELIPFSFVVDWFINVEQFLSSGTDFIGLTCNNAYHTKKLTVIYEYQLEVTYRWWISGTYWPNDQYWYSTQRDALVNKGTHTVRSQGLANPTLSVRPLYLPSWKRALTATSLLVQQLSRR